MKQLTKQENTGDKLSLDEAISSLRELHTLITDGCRPITNAHWIEKLNRAKSIFNRYKK